jgi:Uma2 family endonuclease
MSTKTLMTVEEYLRTSFDDGDREFPDREIVGRYHGDLPHGWAHGELIFLLHGLGKDQGLQALPSIRTRITSTRYRVPDIGVWLPGDIGRDIPRVSPFLVVEILSPDDRIPRMKIKVEDYLGAGVEWIWLVDPDERQAVCYSQRNNAGSVCDLLRTESPKIEIPLEKVFAD